MARRSDEESGSELDSSFAPLEAYRLMLEPGHPRFVEQPEHPFLVLSTSVEPLAGASPPTPWQPTAHAPSKVRCQWRAAPVTKRAGANPFAALVTLGRAVSNDLVLVAPTISKFHAYFIQEGGAFGLADAGSTFGTYVGEEKLPARGKPLVLRDGAEIRFGEGTAAMFLTPASFALFLKNNFPGARR